MHDGGIVTCGVVLRAYVLRCLCNDVVAPEGLPVHEGVPAHVEPDVLAVREHVEYVLVKPAPDADGGEPQHVLYGEDVTEGLEVEQEDPCLKVLIGIAEAQVVCEIGPNRVVVALELSDGVGVARGGEEIAVDPDVEEPRRIV